MKPSRPLIRWHSQHLEYHPDAGRSREKRGKEGNLKRAAQGAPSRSRRRLGERPLCHEADNQEGWTRPRPVFVR